MSGRTRLSRCCRRAAVIVWCALAMTGAAAAGAPCETPVLTLAEAAALLRVDVGDLELLAAKGGVPGRRIGAEWRFSCEALVIWLRNEPPPTAAVVTLGTIQQSRELVPLGPASMANVQGTGLASSQAPAAAPVPASPSTPDAEAGQAAAIGEAPAERTAEDVFLRGNRVLLGRGDVVLDVGLFYARSDALQLATADNNIGLSTVEQRAFTTFLVGRVGIFRETELFASTAFNRQDQRQWLGSTTLASSGRSALGATTVGVRHTLLHEAAKRPDVVFTLSGQVPTHDALPAVGGGVVAVKSVDPVVLFANANYFHAFASQSGGRARLTPVDSVDLSTGYGLGLNDTLAISMSVGGLFTGRTVDLPASRPPSVFSARFSLTTWLAEGLYLEPSVSFGLSGPNRTFAFGVTLPYTF